MTSNRRVSRLAAGLMVALPLGLTTCLMAADQHFALSVPFGFVCLALASVGLLVLFQGPVDGFAVAATPARSDAPRRIVHWLFALGLLLVALRLAVAGVLPAPRVTAALLVPAAFLGLTVSSVRLAVACDLLDAAVPLGRRYGFWLVVLQAVVQLPLLGSFSLIDPWETHYAEVAREMLARDDWISLWWAQDGWFWSKPVLGFWLMGLSFSLLGVQYQPDQMIASVAQGQIPHPEWAVRMPVFLMAVLASYVLYKAVARVTHPRAGFLSGLILTSMPYWFLMGRQCMTDMPYVAPLTASVAFFVLGLATDRDQKVWETTLVLGRSSFRVNGYHVLSFFVMLCVLPQVCYLFSRNVTLHLDSGVLSVHADRFFAGSGGANCRLPGNDACSSVSPISPTWQPALLALLWLFLLLLLVRRVLAEAKARTLCYLASWVLLTLSAMSKGAPGLVLPLFVMLVFLGATGRWRELLALRPASLCLIFAVVLLPWYLQMLARHGSAFAERLLLHDMYKRAFDHVHDTNQGVDVSFRYYVWQLGYGLFPWSGLAVAGVLHWARQTPEQKAGETLTAAEISTLMALWFIAAFAMFTLSGTKFHHYILPAVPPLAVLSGILQDRMLGELRCRRGPAAYLAGIAVVTVSLLLGIALLSGGPVDGVIPEGQAQVPPAPLAGCLLLALGLGTGGLTLWRAGLRATGGRSGAEVMTGLFGLVALVSAWLVGRDLLSVHGEGLPGQVLLMQLFTYQYKRPWPDSLDFGGLLLAFCGVACTAFGALCHPKSRPHGAAIACALGIVWCAFGANLYLLRAAPHWGQRESIAAYYRLRQTTEPPLVAYQMNWKGENFYTGNRLVAFVKSGSPFKRWLAQQRERGVRTLYFTTEPSRIDALKRELGSYQQFEVLTSDRINNKFMIARVTL